MTTAAATEIETLRAQLRAGQEAMAAARPTIPELRASVETAMSVKDAPADYRVERLTISNIPVEHIIPPSADEGLRILYLHGGGYVYCSTRTHRAMVARLANAADAAAFSVEYRLAPENPFPAALEDALAVYRALAASDRGSDRLVIAGDSAGGGLAVALALALKEHGLPQPAAICVISPWTDLTQESPYHASHAAADLVVTATDLASLADCYAGAQDRRNPLISPAFGDLSGLPPIFIQVGSEEILLGDAVKLAERAASDRVRVRLDVWPQMPHVWHLHADELGDAREALLEAGAWLRTQTGAAARG